ncbi:MAG: RDD family protein [Deltaproteobacteria bacterium]|nr:RDD family protein [Deltaproteobacteria bacterium]
MSENNPYASPQAALSDGFGEERIELPADRGTRLGARMIDQFIYLLAVSPAFVLVLELDGGGEMSTAAISAGALAGVLALAVLAVNLNMLNQRGQTIGKRILGVRIVRMDGSDISLGRIIGLRVLPIQLLGLIPGVGGIFGLADSLFIFRDDRRCLHDLLADSKVIQAP